MEQKSKAIGSTTYLVTQMDAIRALKVQTKFVKIIGPGALALLDKSQSIQQKLAMLIPKLMDNFDDAVINDLVLSLFEKGIFTKEGETPKVLDFAIHFAGKPFEMWKVVAFILEVNFDMGELSGLNLPITKEENLTKDH